MMTIREKTVEIVRIVIVPLTIVIVAFLAMQIANRYMRITAIDQCGHVASVKWTGTDKSQVTEPFKIAYEKCIKDKGF